MIVPLELASSSAVSDTVPLFVVIVPDVFELMSSSALSVIAPAAVVNDALTMMSPTSPPCASSSKFPIPVVEMALLTVRLPAIVVSVTSLMLVDAPATPSKLPIVSEFALVKVISPPLAPIEIARFETSVVESVIFTAPFALIARFATRIPPAVPVTVESVKMCSKAIVGVSVRSISELIVTEPIRLFAPI